MTMNYTEGSSKLEPTRRGFITNYPPFRRWSKKVVKDFLALEPVNIYVHIPFCTQTCSYCYYMTVTKQNATVVDSYVDAVCAEIEHSAKHFNLHERPVNSIYFGGGTPTTLNEKNLRKIIDCIKDNFNVDDPEFTIEGEPMSLTKKKIGILDAVGANRISIGVQSFDDQIIKLSERKHDAQKALDVIAALKKQSDWVVNIDLLSGLAGETPETWEKSLKTALSTGVDSITIYKMEAYSNTTFGQQVLAEDLNLPNDKEEEEFMKTALPMLEANDYLPWCTFTFTKSGMSPNVYASSIWNGDDLCSFGASAFGKIGRFVYQNYADMHNYMNIVEKGVLPVWRGNRLNNVEEMIRAILLGMKLTRLDTKEFQYTFGVDLLKVCENELYDLIKEGFVKIEDGIIQMTQKGLLYSDFTGKTLAIGVSKRFGFSDDDEKITKTYTVLSKVV